MPKTTYYDIKSELTDREIDRLYTALGKRGLYSTRRELRNSPTEIALSLGWDAAMVAKLAGRKETNREVYEVNE